MTDQLDLPATHRWPVELRHENLVLRPLRRRDQRSWDQVRSRNAAWTAPWDATLPPGAGSSRPSFTTMVRNHDRAARAGSALPWAICWDERWPDKTTRASRLPISGQVTVSNIVWGSARFATIGYWVDEALAGRGVVPTAVAMACDYCFWTLDLHRIEINIRPENGKSLRVVEKLGFRDEGERRAYLHIDGDWRDHRSFALTADEVPEGVLTRYLSSISSTHP